MRQPREHMVGSAISRRDLLAGASAAPFAETSGDFTNDPTVAMCETWFARRAEANRLEDRWGHLELELTRHHDWYKLTQRQRCRLPAGQELFDIDERLEALDSERGALLKRLPTVRAISRSGLMAKLAVAAIAIEPDDFKDEHNLIASILRDLKMMPIGTV